MKEIKGYEGLYMISKCGKVWACPRQLSTINQRRGGFFYKHRLNESGYPTVCLYKSGKRKTFLVHRLVAVAYLQNPDNKPFINHKNGIKTDCRLKNLEWCTPKENSEHASRAGLLKQKRGEDSPNTNLTWTDVEKIRNLRENGIFLRDIGLIFGISQSNVCEITKGRTWKK